MADKWKVIPAAFVRDLINRGFVSRLESPSQAVITGSNKSSIVATFRDTHTHNNYKLQLRCGPLENVALRVLIKDGDVVSRKLGHCGALKSGAVGLYKLYRSGPL